MAVADMLSHYLSTKQRDAVFFATKAKYTVETKQHIFRKQSNIYTQETHKATYTQERDQKQVLMVVHLFSSAKLFFLFIVWNFFDWGVAINND